MTCIVGFIDRGSGTVTIGGDSASSSESNVFIRKDPKLFRLGEFVIGCTSSFRMIQLLRFSFTPPEIGSKDIYHYMCTDFIDSVRKCFKSGGYLQKNENGDETGGSFLVGCRGRLFKVEEDFQVGETLNGIDAVGCGANFALGAMYTLIDSDMSPNEKVVKSLEAASFFGLGVSPPFICMST